jgi:pyruvate dehydrogenase E2 component (dihydrolipoamide acetyltransferase)
MTVDVTMPQMGADMTEGTVVKWLKQVGDEVTRGESIAEIETDKANVELEAFDSGVLLKVLAPEGTVVPVGELIAVLGQAGEEVGDTSRDCAGPGTASTRPGRGCSCAGHPHGCGGFDAGPRGASGGDRRPGQPAPSRTGRRANGADPHLAGSAEDRN